MFEEFMGLPAHPLVLHAAVVFVPLLALLTVGYAFVPPIRPHTRWVLGLLAVGAPLSALLAKLSGDAFFDRMRSASSLSKASSAAPIRTAFSSRAAGCSRRCSR
ncbi:hypothetical protein ABZU42_13610, partial [Micromonospora profundi]